MRVERRTLRKDLVVSREMKRKKKEGVKGRERKVMCVLRYVTTERRRRRRRKR